MKVWLTLPRMRVLVRVRKLPRRRQTLVVEENTVIKSEGTDTTDFVGVCFMVISDTTRIPGKKEYHCEVCFPPEHNPFPN